MSSPAKNNSRRFPFFARQINSTCQVELPVAACHVTASKQEVNEVCEPSINTSGEQKKRPLSTSTFIVPYEKSLLCQDQELRKENASAVTVESSTTPWPTTDASSQGSSSLLLSDDEGVVKPEPKTTDVSEESCESDEDESYKPRDCGRMTRNVFAHKPQRPKKNIWRMPVYTDPLIVGDSRKPKTAFENWTDEVNKILLSDADRLLGELDEIIPDAEDQAAYRYELPRPKTRRGRATVPSQVGSLNKKNIIKDLQPEGGKKQQQVSTDAGRGVQDKCTALAVKKCVRFVDVPAEAQSLAEAVSDGAEEDCNERVTEPENLVYDEAELVLIDEIEKEFGIT